MKKRVYRVLPLIFLIAVLLAFSVCAASDDGDDGIDCMAAAEKLNSLGVFRGTDSGFELDRNATRAEMLVMIIRLLGEESNAVASKTENPFTDSLWADRYIAYGYEQKLIMGMSDTRFGTDETATAKQFCTMLLRAMGYVDKADFIYDSACRTAECVLLTEIADGELSRGDMACIAYRALSAKTKAGKTLAECLIEKSVFTDKAYASVLDKYSDTTVMIYMVASDLESEGGFATKDIAEMIAADKSENLRVLLQSGGTVDWKNEFLADGKVQRSEISGGELNVLQTLESTEMLNSESLSDFILWCAKRAPAERYILILWDHGMGTMGGFGKDEISGEDAMRLCEIQKGLKDADVRFSIVGFDTCLMATAETAFAIKDSADYLIGAEDISAYSGWHYTTFLNALARTPDISTVSLAKLICNSHITRTNSLTTTISAIDLSGADILYRQLLELCNGTGILQRATSGLKVCGASDGGYDQYDIIQLLGKIPKANDALLAAEQMIVYTRRGAMNGYSNGLAVYVPTEQEESRNAVLDDLLKIGYENKYLINICEQYKEEKQ